MNKLVRQFLEECCTGNEAERFDTFYKSLGNKCVSFDEELTTNILANVDIKHRFAKWLFKKHLEGEHVWIGNCCDARLMSLLYYQIRVYGLNHVGNEASHNIPMIAEAYRECDNVYSPVRMMPGNDFHQSYRVFVINLLCFRDKRFIMGCRCDTGPIHPEWMLYHKGCKPIGEKTDTKGREWTLFEVNASLTDDNTAVFSNGLDGDGVVEVCDWVNENDVRVVFRASY